MKHLFALFISLVPIAIWSQWMDPITPPWPSVGWTGDTDSFTLNANGQLQSHFAEAGFYQLMHELPTSPNAKELSCFYRQNIAGSSNNFGRILIYESGQPDSVGHNNNAGVKGWVIQWGNTGSSDEIQIFWNNGAIWEPMADTFFIANGVYGQFKMIQDSMVHFFFQDNDSAQFYPLLNTALPMNFQPMHLCLQAQCTSSNVNNFYWDNFYFGPPIIPLEPMNTGKRSIVINEILPDPDPPSPLGKSEFIELYNNSSDSILLTDWVLYNTTTPHVLPNTFIPPKKYVIICHADDTALYSGNVIGLSSFSALTNNGDSITLCSPNGNIIDVFQYNLENYKNQYKEDGGWSLEQINPLLPCSGAFNWAAHSSFQGASPGAANAILDTLFTPPPPTILDWGLDSQNQLFLWSNLPWEQDSIAIQCGAQRATIYCKPSYDSLIVPLPSHTEDSPFSIDSIQFCNASVPCSFEINLPRISGFNGESIIFNEIMYDPKDGEHSFVELYNNSDQNISLDHFWIENQNGTLSSIQRHHHFIEANNRIAISESSMNQKCGEYTIHQTNDLPYFTVSNGTIYLGFTFYRLDTLVYHDSLHHPNLVSTQGVSLERVEGSLEKETWLSAGSMEGGQTPGCKNSQQWNYDINDIQFQCTPAYFSPNQDGYNDVIAFSYSAPFFGVETRLNILSMEGYPIIQLSDGSWQGSKAQWTWDGMDAQRNPCAFGLYYALLEVWTGEAPRAIKTIKSFVLSP